jgi:mono/diheme cytochrome c family protein
LRYYPRALRYGFLSLMAVGLLGLAFLGASARSSQSGVVQPSEQVQRGAYLVTTGGCGDCHSPKIFTERGPEPDPERLLSGHPADSRLPELDIDRITPDGWILFSNDLTASVGPWGISFSANLTSDEETGLGRWTEAAFITTMRTGLHWGVGPPLLPPMPWQNLSAASDEDLKAIFAYLRSTRPVHNAVPAGMTLEELRASKAKR